MSLVVSVVAGPLPEARAASPTTITVAGKSVAAIEAAISQAVAGDTVYFPGGSYTIDRAFLFKSDVSYVGDMATPAVLVGQGATSLMLKHGSGSPLHNVTIKGLQFDNIEMQLSGGSDYTSFSNVTLKDCLFKNGKRSTPWASDYLLLAYTVNATIDGCTFLRNSNSGGRGLLLSRTHVTVVKDSFFGTTRDLETGTPNGYFKTAINVYGWDEAASPALGNKDVVIDGNVWRRAAFACPSGVACEDHGLYAWGAKDLFVTGNYGDGWTNSSSGGNVKLRNGEDAFVLDNHFMTSGIKTYTHWGTEQLVKHLFRVRVGDNRIDMPDDPLGVEGIFYRRISTADGSTTGSVCQPTGVEDDIYIVDNKFVDGGTIQVKCAVGPEVCVQGNVGASYNFNGLAVDTTGCVVPNSWDQPLAGIHRGDFNGDGQQDFVHRVKNTSGARYWRAHLSSGDGYVDQDWGDGVTVTTDTEKYGVHVADFNGDGLDDIAYRAVCGSPSVPCWRVHRSTGNGFMAPRNYGDGVLGSSETFRFGFHTGDFDGDGRDDIVFRGVCGTDAHPCWTVLASQSDNTFAAMDWSDGLRVDPVETDNYGLLIGDYNGDGRDDIAYRGLCGSPTVVCMRVHRSTGSSSFTPENWGNGFYFDGQITPHFEMRVGDKNGDGKADIAYRGRCGSPGVAQWRYHMGGTTYPFTVTCSPSGF